MVKGPVNIYGNTGPGNERWPLVKFAVAPLISPYKIVHGPVPAWSKFLYGPLKSPSKIVVGPVVHICYLKVGKQGGMKLRGIGSDPLNFMPSYFNASLIS